MIDDDVARTARQLAAECVRGTPPPPWWVTWVETGRDEGDIPQVVRLVAALLLCYRAPLDERIRELETKGMTGHPCDCLQCQASFDQATEHVRSEAHAAGRVEERARLVELIRNYALHCRRNDDKLRPLPPGTLAEWMVDLAINIEEGASLVPCDDGGESGAHVGAGEKR